MHRWRRFQGDKICHESSEEEVAAAAEGAESSMHRQRCVAPVGCAADARTGASGQPPSGVESGNSRLGVPHRLPVRSVACWRRRSEAVGTPGTHLRRVHCDRARAEERKLPIQRAVQGTHDVPFCAEWRADDPRDSKAIVVAVREHLAKAQC